LNGYAGNKTTLDYIVQAWQLGNRTKHTLP
jgi:hypothetical protein